jgi:ethanolamine utilization protein EutA (predicted chaperonin)
MSSSSSSARNSIALKAKNFNFKLEVSGRTILLSNIQGYANYALFDMQGKIVSAGTLEKGNAQIDVPRAGTYIIRVGKKLQKVVVE